MTARDRLADVIEAAIDSVFDIGTNNRDLADSAADAVLGMIKPLALHDRRNGYWGGKCSSGYQVAHTNSDLFRVRLHGKVVCRDIKGFARAVKWANAHHRAQILAALGLDAGEGQI